MPTIINKRSGRKLYVILAIVSHLQNDGTVLLYDADDVANTIKQIEAHGISVQTQNVTERTVQLKKKIA